MIRPKPLKPGDKIGLVSTARKMGRDELQPAIDQIKLWGYEVCLAGNLFESHHQFAGTGAQRLADFQNFIDDPEIRAIICCRGGYGTIHIVDDLNFIPLIENPKWIAGYSDVTVIHNKLAKLGIESLHSTMPINFATSTPGALQSLEQALKGETLEYTIAAHPFNRNGNAHAPLTGGNLSMLYSQAGSDTALQTAGQIIFMEDLDEYLYHIDRMMYNLKRNGYFESPAAVIVGGMDEMNDNTVPFGETAEEIIHRHLHGYDFPVCFGFPAGHMPDNRTLIFGREAALLVSETAVTLTFDG